MTCSECHGRQRPARQSRPLPEATRRWRLFVAAPLPGDAADRLWNALAAVRARHADVRWLPPEKLHLTLLFLGSTDAARAPELTAAVSRTAAAHAASEVVTGEGGGRVGGRRGGVIWLRLARGAADIARLARDLDDAIGSAIFDAHNAPRPHLTVARGATEAALADVRAAAASVSVAWTVSEIVLFRSHSDPGGSRYEEIASAAMS